MRKTSIRSIAATALLVASSMMAMAGSSVRAEDLKILTWEGYADDQWVKEFEKDTGATVKVSYTGSVDEIFAKMEGSKGADFDVVAIETSSYKRLYQQKLIQPLDLSKLPNYQNLSPVFQKIDAITFDGKPYAAPYAWGSLPLIYDKKAFPTPPDSWEVMWDPKFAGKILAMDDANNEISNTALVLGYKDPFNLTDEQFAAVRKKLLEQKALVLNYYAGFDDGISIFAQNAVPMMFSMGEPQVGMLQSKGVDAAMTIPKEGAIGWIDCWTISSATKHVDLAHKWINFMLEKRVGNYISTKTGYGNTTDADANKAIGMTYADKLTFFQPPEDPKRRVALWNEVKATPVP